MYEYEKKNQNEDGKTVNTKKKRKKERKDEKTKRKNEKRNEMNENPCKPITAG